MVRIEGPRPAGRGRSSSGGPAHGPGRSAWADNLKVALVAGVIVAHATIAWTGVGNWVLTEPTVREPLFSVLVLLSGVGALFGMAMFFLVAGMFTPPSLRRKGLRRFLVDRAIRLGVPLLAFIVLLAPFVESWDSDNADWDQGFWALAVDVVWFSWPLPPAWGPTWFLAVLLLFSALYALWRTFFPRATAPAARPSGWLLVALGAAVAVASYVIRMRVPLSAEVFRLALGQAPAWLAGFTMGVVGAERAWLDPVDRGLARGARRVAWVAIGCFAVLVGAISVTGGDLAPFTGGGTWQSALFVVPEAALVVAVPVWLVDAFRRRANARGPVLREASRAAFAAFLIHQAVLVGLIVLIRHVPWPPEVEYVLVAALAVVVSFAAAALLVRVPGVSRVL
jgi:peptidoglycan/LPS O-acetylase OafA/YrhL